MHVRSSGRTAFVRGIPDNQPTLCVLRSVTVVSGVCPIGRKSMLDVVGLRSPLRGGVEKTPSQWLVPF